VIQALSTQAAEEAFADRIRPGRSVGRAQLCWPKTSFALKLWSMTSFCGRIIASKL